VPLGLNKIEFTELQFSVGKTTRQRRPLSPVEVGDRCAKSIEKGFSVSEITDALKMTDKSMIPKFLRVRNLDPGVRHLVSWGFSGDGAIGFSVAAQLARIPDNLQLRAAEAIIKYQFTRNEMISVIQLLERSKDPLDICVDRVVHRRPVIRIQQIVLGAITSVTSTVKLQKLSQLQRDDILERVIHKLYPNVGTITAKLGIARFTIIGGKSVAETVTKDSSVERNINKCLEEELA
jgi:hypothetical protein